MRLYRRQQSFDRDELERKLFKSCDINHDILDKQDISDIEPDLKRVFTKAVHVKDSIWVSNPQTLCERYATLFTELGGEILNAEVTHIEQCADTWQLTANSKKLTTDKLVIALGAWTPTFTKQLGYRNPIVSERGYHTVFAPEDNKKLHHPIFDVDSSYVMIPMEMGLRITSGTNLTIKEAPRTPFQLDKIIPKAKQAFPMAEQRLSEPWMGRRSSTPDSLPLIGPAPNHKISGWHMGIVIWDLQWVQ